jgi:hypothetical protein
VLSSVTGDVLESSIVSNDWNVESDNCITSPNEVKVMLGNISLGCGSVEEEFDLFKETWLCFHFFY